jgi:hypothetical protein
MNGPSRSRNNRQLQAHCGCSHCAAQQTGTSTLSSFVAAVIQAEIDPNRSKREASFLAGINTNQPVFGTIAWVSQRFSTVLRLEPAVETLRSFLGNAAGVTDRLAPRSRLTAADEPELPHPKTTTGGMLKAESLYVTQEKRRTVGAKPGV